MKASSKVGVSRRNLGLAIAAMPAALVMAQQAPATEDLLAAAREQMKSMGEELRTFKVPIATEPSFAFRP